MGWLTTEELVWDSEGRLRTHAPSTYKIPCCRRPAGGLQRRSVADGENREATIYRSKAVGEPPLMLAISVFSALTDAVASVGDHRVMPEARRPGDAGAHAAGGRAAARGGGAVGFVARLTRRGLCRW